MNQVFWRIAGRMACSMAMNQADIYEHLQNICASFDLDEELVLLAFSLLHRYIKEMDKQLVLKSDAEYMYVFFICITLAQKALLDEGDATALNLALSLGLRCEKLKANQIKIFKNIGFNIFISYKDLLDIIDILPLREWQKFSFVSYGLYEITTQNVAVNQCFEVNTAPFAEKQFIIHQLNREIYQPQNQLISSITFIIAQQEFAKQQQALAYI
ncbi:MAG: hypothetical protein EZS28_016230 [Streblomastix strix]|uniref:Uncharacterized protein n=1 Tax=Streblomastix strix TaxID=222440 RepID=A0A5J4W0D3_9EUKA|nr:MAG: hypothetical protein EZS28_016230 [Streblomastix strix]